MNVWADKIDDLQLSVNDGYMIGLMTGWMVLFMGIYDGLLQWSILGFSVVLFCLYGIRTQLFVSEQQFLRGMIPHHSMAVHMSKQLQTKPHSLSEFLEGLVRSQEKEIQIMKLRIQDSF